MRIRFILALVCSTSVAMAQIKPTFFQYGPKIGAQLATVQIIDSPIESSFNNNVKLQGGIFTRFNVGDFSLQPEFVFQQKGAVLSNTPPQTHTYNYLSTPILLGYSPIKGVYFEAGPEFSRALNAGKSNTVTQKYGPDAATDMGVIVGTRINMLDMFSLVSLNIRYSQGLTNSTTRLSGTTPLDFRNRTIELSVTYTFSEYYKWWKKYGNGIDLLKKKKK